MWFYCWILLWCSKYELLGGLRPPLLVLGPQTDLVGPVGTESEEGEGLSGDHSVVPGHVISHLNEWPGARTLPKSGVFGRKGWDDIGPI